MVNHLNVIHSHKDKGNFQVIWVGISYYLFVWKQFMKTFSKLNFSFWNPFIIKNYQEVKGLCTAKETSLWWHFAMEYNAEHIRLALVLCGGTYKCCWVVVGCSRGSPPPHGGVQGRLEMLRFYMGNIEFILLGLLCHILVSQSARKSIWSHRVYAAIFLSITNLIADTLVTLLSSQYFFLTGLLGMLVHEHKCSY